MPSSTPPASTRQSLQHNHRTGACERGISALCLLLAVGLLGFDGWRVATHWTPGAIPALALIAAGWLLADFLSGLVHWAADTWGRIDTPWIGRRFLHPFRVHHVNPRDIFARGFLDLNGDVAMLTLPVLAGVALLPLESAVLQAIALLLTATAGFVLPTNQIHQWAHQDMPPSAVRRLQAARLVLDRRAHAIHHADPAGGHYCITTGWCNRSLARWKFHARCERLITRLTGLQPRVEENLPPVSLPSES